MTQENVALWVQVAAVVAAVLASIVALAVSAMDRRNSRRIADEDRRAALKQAHLMFELQALVKLSQNLSRGGHSDPNIVQDMAAERAALVGALGPERIPRNWGTHVEETPEELRAMIADESTDFVLAHSIEAHLALTEVAAEIRRLNRLST